MATAPGDDAQRTIVTDSEGVIRHWGGQWQDLLGYTGDEAVGHKVDLFIPPALRGMHWRGFSKALETGTLRRPNPTTLDVTAMQDSGARMSVRTTLAITRPAINKRGELVPILATLDIRRDDGGQPDGVVGTIFGGAPGWAGAPWRLVLPLLAIAQSIRHTFARRRR